MYCCVPLDWSAHCLGAASNNTTGTHLICLSVESTCCGVMRTYCHQNSRHHITMQPFQYRDEIWPSQSGALTCLLVTLMLEGTDNQLALHKYTATSIRSRGSVVGALLGKSVDGRPDN